ncbi:MAG: YggS family pyridoxal phosphate-dependent enzyme [Pseudohongiellaceae bacterium]
MPSIAENVRLVRDRIAALEASHGRPAGRVSLLAVSKKHGPERLREAYEAGQRAFGENYVQEALDKMTALTNPADPEPLTDIVWHFIGPLQSNKTREVTAHFGWVHSVDRLKIARRLSEQRPEDMPPLNVCVQVNISGEASKSGVAPEEVEALCETIAALPRLTLRGLMAIPAPAVDLQAQRAVYRPLAEQFRSLQRRHATMDTLSIGMSGDLEAAIAEGGTMVRVGTALFGARNSK